MLYLISFRLWQKGKSFFIQNVAFVLCVQDQIEYFSKNFLDFHYLKVSLFYYYCVDIYITYISVISICQCAWAIKNKEKNRILLMIERKSSTNRHRYPSNQTEYWFLWKKSFQPELPNLVSQQLIYFSPYFNILCLLTKLYGIWWSW